MFSEVCRICLINKPGELFNIFIPFDNLKIDEILMECAPVYVSQTETPILAQYICKNCFNKLKEFYEFRILCVKSDKELKNLDEFEYYSNGLLKNVKQLNKFEEGTCDLPDINSPNNEYLLEIIVDKTKKKQKSRNLEKGSLKNVKIEKKNSKKKEKLKSVGDKTKRKSKMSKVKMETLEEEEMKAINLFGDLICKFCSKTYSSDNCLKQHIRLVHFNETPKFNCPTCHKVFKYKRNLSLHCIKKHDAIKEKCDDEEAGVSFICEICGMNCKHKSQYTNHLNSHKEKQFKCDLCENMFKSKESLKLHKRVIHDGIKMYTCEFCGKIFGLNSNFHMHRRVHLNIKNFKCTECNKAFIAPSNLKKHMLIHTKERPCGCDICGKKFPLRHHLKKHLMCIHKIKLENKPKREKRDKIWPVYNSNEENKQLAANKPQ